MERQTTNKQTNNQKDRRAETDRLTNINDNKKKQTNIQTIKMTDGEATDRFINKHSE